MARWTLSVLVLLGAVALALAQTTAAPAQDPTTAAPAQDPTTAAPAQDPITAAPAQDPTTAAPAQDPTTAAPAQDPTTAAPAQDPTTAPGDVETVSGTTDEPDTAAPTAEDETSTTNEPTTFDLDAIRDRVVTYVFNDLSLDDLMEGLEEEFKASIVAAIREVDPELADEIEEIILTEGSVVANVVFATESAAKKVQQETKRGLLIDVNGVFYGSETELDQPKPEDRFVAGGVIIGAVVGALLLVVVGAILVELRWRSTHKQANQQQSQA